MKDAVDRATAQTDSGDDPIITIGEATANVDQNKDSALQIDITKGAQAESDHTDPR